MFFDDVESWQSKAACIGMDLDLFWPEKGDNLSVSQAKAICRPCPVREECLDLALSREEKGGIWGGTSQRERKPMRTAKARAARELKKRLEL